MSRWPSFVAGALAGVLAGVLAVRWLVPATVSAADGAVPVAAPAPHEPHAERSATLEYVREPALGHELAGTLPRGDEAAGLAAARAAALEADREEQPSHTLPTLRRCLVEPEFNPEARDCLDDAVCRELQIFIDEQNKKLSQLESQRDALVESVLAAKLAANLDPPETWSSYPKDDILLCRSYLSLGADGQRKKGATILRRGEVPELESLERELDATRAAAVEELRRRIASSCPR